MLRTRFVYAILASLAVIALGGLYQMLRPEASPAPSAPIAAPATSPEAPADAAAPEAGASTTP